MATISRWKQYAQHTIARALVGCPADATEQQVRAIISAAYPWGDRQHYPYRMWCAVVRDVIKKRFGSSEKKETPPVVIRYLVVPRSDRLWIQVDCGWCKDLDYRKCLSCGRLHEAIPMCTAHRDFAPLAMAGVNDEAGIQVFLDLCEEILGVRPALWEAKKVKVRKARKTKENP